MSNRKSATNVVSGMLGAIGSMASAVGTVAQVVDVTAQSGLELAEYGNDRAKAYRSDGQIDIAITRAERLKELKAKAADLDVDLSAFGI